MTENGSANSVFWAMKCDDVGGGSAADPHRKWKIQTTSGNHDTLPASKRHYSTSPTSVLLVLCHENVIFFCTCCLTWPPVVRIADSWKSETGQMKAEVMENEMASHCFVRLFVEQCWIQVIFFHFVFPTKWEMKRFVHQTAKTTTDLPRVIDDSEQDCDEREMSNIYYSSHVIYITKESW